jgi:hypothetical protein
LRTAATAVAAADEEEKDKRDGERVSELEDERRRGLGILFPPFLSSSQLTLLLLLLLLLLRLLRFPTSTTHPSAELLLRIFKAARHHPLAAETPAHLRLFLLLSVTLCYTHNAAAAAKRIIMIILHAAGCLWHPRQAQEKGKLQAPPRPRFKPKTVELNVFFFSPPAS